MNICISDILTNTEQSAMVFLQDLQNKYPNEVQSTDLTYLGVVFSKLSEADIEWKNVTNYHVTSTLENNDYRGYKVRRFVFEDIKITKELTNRNEKLDEDSKNYLHGGHERSKRSAGGDIKMTSNNKDNKHSPQESTEEEIARCFHAMSITIVLILLTEVRNPSNSSHLRK
jgi:hypothetical protein